MSNVERTLVGVLSTLLTGPTRRLQRADRGVAESEFTLPRNEQVGSWPQAAGPSDAAGELEHEAPIRPSGGGRGDRNAIRIIPLFGVPE